MQHMIYNNMTKHYFVLESDGNTTSFSQFIMQHKRRPDIIVA